MATTVQITAPCPACGTDATWHGRIVQPGGATAYDIDCLRCDQPWTLARQIARHTERLTSLVLRRNAA